MGTHRKFTAQVHLQTPLQLVSQPKAKADLIGAKGVFQMVCHGFIFSKQLLDQPIRIQGHRRSNNGQFQDEAIPLAGLGLIPNGLSHIRADRDTRDAPVGESRSNLYDSKPVCLVRQQGQSNRFLTQ